MLNDVPAVVASTNCHATVQTNLDERTIRILSLRKLRALRGSGQSDFELQRFSKLTQFSKLGILRAYDRKILTARRCRVETCLVSLGWG
jgi:hypothetical protein